jgi:ABC-type sugar transport system ATPase subunit
MDLLLEGIRVTRGERLVLDVPALRIQGSHRTAIVGPNGSGKTTLIRAIAGLEPCGGGRVTLDGSPVRPAEHLAYVFQEEVFLRRTVRANLELGLRLRGVDRATIRNRIEHAATLVGILHLLNRRADHMSGGEARRVSLARALSLQAPLMLLDEPLTGVDAKTYSRLLDDLRHLLTAAPATTVIVTHKIEEARQLADDVVVLVDGRVQAHGMLGKLIANPPTPAVADVLGRGSHPPS